MGDSWTWGSDLPPYLRCQQVYGNIIAQQLNTDWLNLALPGSNNFFIAERVEELGRIVSDLEYEKIYLICTFTETGRSFDSQHDRYIDYVSWFKQNHIDKFLAFLNAECSNRIRAVAQQHNLILRVGTNFVDPVGFTTDMVPWFRQLGITCDAVSCVGHTGASRLQNVKEFVQNDMIYKQWFSDVISLSQYTENVLNSPLLYRNHPTAQGHATWANSILQTL